MTADDATANVAPVTTGKPVLPWLVVAMGGLYVALGGVVAVLLPAAVERIDPEGKVAALGVIASISFAVTLFAQPLLGAASDATRRRFRGRAPWMLASALVGGLAVAAMGWAGSLVALAILWAVAQFALNGVDITVSTAVVDDYPSGRRGRPSGALAASVAVGTAAGAIVAGVLAGSPRLAFLAVAIVAVVAAAVCATARRGQTPPPLPMEPSTRERRGAARISRGRSPRGSRSLSASRL